MATLLNKERLPLDYSRRFQIILRKAKEESGGGGVAAASDSNNTTAAAARKTSKAHKTNVTTSSSADVDGIATLRAGDSNKLSRTEPSVNARRLQLLKILQQG